MRIKQVFLPYLLVSLECRMPCRTYFGFALSFDNALPYLTGSHEQVEPMRAGEEGFPLSLIALIKLQNVR